MSEAKKEQLSALMDGEVDDHQKDVIDQLLKDTELMHTWTRYHLISDCINRRLPENLDRNLTAEISQSLQDEPAIVAPGSFPRSFIKPVAGFAIAASVAALAVLGIQQQQLGGPHELPQDMIVKTTPGAATDRVVRAPVRQASGQRTGGRELTRRTADRGQRTECGDRERRLENGGRKHGTEAGEEGADNNNCP